MWQSARALEKLELEGRTRAWLSRYVGLTTQSINIFLSGKRGPPKPIVKLIAQALNTTEAYLMGEDLKTQKEEQTEQSA